MSRLALILVLAVVPIAIAPMTARAGEAAIKAARAVPESGGTWRIEVTLAHGDTGWDHYADGWAVETVSGERLGYRELLHPHVNEQPFTRSLAGVPIPEGISTVHIRAHDSVHGWTKDVFPLSLP